MQHPKLTYAQFCAMVQTLKESANELKWPMYLICDMGNWRQASDYQYTSNLIAAYFPSSKETIVYWAQVWKLVESPETVKVEEVTA